MLPVAAELSGSPIKERDRKEKGVWVSASRGFIRLTMVIYRKIL